MAIFQLTHAGISVVVRAKCLTCARGIAADNAGPEGPRVWRDGTMSTCELVRDTDKPGLILRSENNDPT